MNKTATKTSKKRKIVWTSAGTSADIAKAQAFIAKEYPTTGRVFSFATSEHDPLVRARREILAAK